MKDAILWKRILNEGIWHPPNIGMEWIEQRIIVSPIIMSSSPYKSTDDYFYDWARFTGIAVPFDKSFWIEAPVVGEWAGSDQQIASHERVGFLVSPLKHRDGWMLRLIQIGPVGSRMGTQLAVTISLDDAGNLRPGGDKIGFHDRALLVPFPQNVPENDIYCGACDFVLHVLQLMSCKNISLEQRENDPKEVRRATKRHGVNAYGYRYHVLVVRPPGARGASMPGVEIGTMPRHVCRGHFAEYGPQFNKGLLFGKYEGRFFIPPHLKGKLENGEVAKDYAIAGGQ